ncbi:peptidase U32 [Methanolobus halotolerans]|uniref:Peptidase U32 n=2 Tax=Methanolobus halotolerans TaxID=2052935 RepID=A0A4E0QSW1_9EURY|nr:peptidase U32 [Methanolobus halotolerans]
MKKGSAPELVTGVRNMASLTACRDYTDAVYFSLNRLSLRSRAKEITSENLAEFVESIHRYGLKGYMAVNSVIYPGDLPELSNVMEAAASAKVDAVIVWDPAAIMKAAANDLKIHISTQANVSNQETVDFYESMGADRVVLARELSLEQIRNIREDTELELEAFVHGAMCQAVSGRCYLSAYLSGKSGNCGECSQPCRWEWSLHSDSGERVVIDGKYLISAKDLCMIEHIPLLVEAGIDSFKLEGRLRNPGYTSTISKCYRKAIDSHLAGTYAAETATMMKKEMSMEYNRGFSTGFYFGYPGPEGLACDHDMNASPVKRQAVGIVTNFFPKNNAASVKLLEQGLTVGDNIIIEGNTTYIEQEVSCLIVDGESVNYAEKGNETGLAVVDRVRKNDRVFRIEKAFL